MGTRDNVKDRLQRAGVKYKDVAALAGVTWSMVWQVVNGRKVSRPVMDAIDKLTGQRAA